MKHTVFVLCGYECIALYSKRLPTLSEISARHKLLAPVLVAGLTVHLYRVCSGDKDVQVSIA